MANSRGGQTIAGMPAAHLGNIVDLLKLVDGVGSGIDGDTLDGKNPSDFAPSGFGLGEAAKDISNQDLNTIKTTGFYRGSNCINRSAGSHVWTYLIVISHDASYVTQIGINFETTATISVRNLLAAVWGTWAPLLRTDVNNDINAKANFNTTSGRLVLPVGANKYAT